MADSPQIMWKRCMEIFQRNVNSQQYQTWFLPMKFKSFSETRKELTVFVPSQFFFEYLEEHFRRLLHLTIRRVFGEGITLVYDVGIAGKETVRQESDLPAAKSAAPHREAANSTPKLLDSVAPAQDLDSQLNDRLNFDNFIEGSSNKLPRQIGKSIAENPRQQAFNPLFIFGPSGVGKTHLVNAIGLRLKELHPQKRVLYLSANLFQTQFQDATRTNHVPDFMRFYQSIDVLIIDDIQEMMGKEGTQFAFFHIFNHLRQLGRHIIMTSDRPPTAMQGMQDRLITRFKCGLLAELERPEEQLRRDILKSKVKHDGLKIPQDVINYISEHVFENVRELEGIINMLMAFSLVYNCDVDLNFTQRVMKHSMRQTEKPITMDMIIESTCEHYHIKQEEVYGKSRKADIVQARQVSMYLAQHHTKLTISKIGTLVGGRNHATVIHSVKTVEDRMKIDQNFKKSITELENKIKNKV